VVGEPWLLSIALNNLGDLLMEEGDYDDAIELFEESLAVGEGARRPSTDEHERTSTRARQHTRNR